MERLLTPLPDKGYEVPDKQGLRDEILTVVSAGDDTTGIATMVGVFNILYNPEIHKRLLEELKTVMPEPESHAPYLELERLPYLVSIDTALSPLPVPDVHPSPQSSRRLFVIQALLLLGRLDLSHLGGCTFLMDASSPPVLALVWPSTICTITKRSSKTPENSTRTDG